MKRLSSTKTKPKNTVQAAKACGQKCFIGNPSPVISRCAILECRGLQFDQNKTENMLRKISTSDSVKVKLVFYEFKSPESYSSLVDISLVLK